MIIYYAKITGVHGIKGEIETSFKDKTYFNSLPRLSIDTPIIINNNTFEILNIKKKNKSFVFSLKEINNINKAKELIGLDIFVDFKYLPKLDNNDFYHAELIGYKVIDANNNNFGKVINVYSIPSNDVIEISLEKNKKKIISIPFVKAYFGKANKKNKTIQIVTNTDFLQ